MAETCRRPVVWQRGGYVGRTFRSHAEEISESEVETEILANGLEDRFDAGDTNLVAEVDR